MDIQGMIVELREERACLDEALMGLERLAQKQKPRRGRPPKWLKPMVIAASKKLNGSTNGSRHPVSASPGN
jgi:hypothetical protein